jgi:hypothetical protein
MHEGISHSLVIVGEGRGMLQHGICGYVCTVLKVPGEWGFKSTTVQQYLR